MNYPTGTQGWKAQLDLGFQKSADKTILARRSQSGPLTVQRPFYPEGDVCHLYLLHPPGGVVGGDELRINIKLEEQANVLITTPGASKFYRSGCDKHPGRQSSQTQILQVANDCALEWFPQENIFFNHANCQLSTKIELDKKAHFMGWEINCYGRPASGESFESGRVNTRFEVYRNKLPIILDGLTIGDNNALSSAISLNGNACFGTFVATQIKPELRDKARLAVSHIQGSQQIGITLIDDILIARCLGQYAEEVSTTLKLIWEILRPGTMGKNACQPRIWAT